MDKQCKKCRSTKPISDFNKHARSKGGYAAQCRECARLEQAKWRQDNPEKNAEYKRRWLEKNPEKKSEYMRTWRERNPEAAQKNLESAKEFMKKAALETRAMATNQGKRWTPEEDAILMAGEGSLLEISKQLGRTYSTCGMRRSVLRERQERREIIDAAHTRINAASQGT